MLAVSASASPPPKKKEGEGDTDKEIARSVELGGLVFPVFDDKGKLKNYIFVNARMLVAPGKDPWKYREKAHYIRDAVLRAAHRTSFGQATNSSKLDEKLAATESMKAANAVLAEDALIGMTFTQIDSQTH